MPVRMKFIPIYICKTKHSMYFPYICHSFLLAPTGALVVMMVYYISAQRSGNFFRFSLSDPWWNSGFPIYCLDTWSIKIEKNVIQGDTNVKLCRMCRMCIRHRAILYSQLLGSPERDDSSPHLAASTNNPAGGRHLAKLLRVKEGNPGWGEEGRRNNWRGR